MTNRSLTQVNEIKRLIESPFDRCLFDEREADVLALAVRGLLPPAIAEALGMSRARAYQLLDSALATINAEYGLGLKPKTIASYVMGEILMVIDV